HRTRFRNPLISLDELIAKRNVNIPAPQTDEIEELHNNVDDVAENATETSQETTPDEQSTNNGSPDFISKPKPIFDVDFDLKAKN
ncbi:MAG: hypothetical protein IJC83_06065, partial [Oscillospiraceae bacterium]|nr:hypothetical protein [Oscillospiraceae bacterium]